MPRKSVGSGTTCYTNGCEIYRQMMIEKANGREDGPKAEAWGAYLKKRKKSGKRKNPVPKSLGGVHRRCYSKWLYDDDPYGFQLPEEEYKKSCGYKKGAKKWDSKMREDFRKRMQSAGLIGTGKNGGLGRIPKGTNWKTIAAKLNPNFGLGSILPEVKSEVKTEPGYILPPPVAACPDGKCAPPVYTPPPPVATVTSPPPKPLTTQPTTSFQLPPQGRRYSPFALGTPPI